MTRLSIAARSLGDAYAARDNARAKSRIATDQQFAAIILKRVAEYEDAYVEAIKQETYP